MNIDFTLYLVTDRSMAGQRKIADIVGNPDLYKDVNKHDFKYIFNVPPENEQESMFFSLKADYELDSGAILTGIVAYDDLDEHLLSDGTSAAFGGYSFGAPESAAECLDTYNNGNLCGEAVPPPPPPTPAHHLKKAHSLHNVHIFYCDKQKNELFYPHILIYNS